MRSVALVRHAASRRVEGIAPDDWGLSRDGLQAAMELGDRLSVAVAVVTTGPSPKATQTAQAICAARGGRLEVIIDDRLREVGRPADGGRRSEVLRYLGGTELDGWEAPASARGRLDDAVNEARRADAPHVLVTHGIVLALWLAPRLGSAPGVVWERLATPDLWRVDPTGSRPQRTG